MILFNIDSILIIIPPNILWCYYFSNILSIYNFMLLWYDEINIWFNIICYQNIIWSYLFSII